FTLQFFFQAEDGIRDRNVTGVQTCALPILSRAKVTGFEYDNQQRIQSVVVKDMLSQESFKVKSQLVINATGPWSDTIRALDTEVETTPQMRPTKGVHLVVDAKKLPVNSPVYFDSGEGDKRMVFVLPRETKKYFGTTDTDYDVDLKHPQVSLHDVEYL